MVSVRWSATLLGCWVGVMVALMVPVGVRGEEPADAFLDALRDSGYYDAALMYLERLDGSPLVSAQFQAELAYQRGVTLVQAASALRDREVRERMLNEAKESLEKFLREQPENPKRLFARRQFSLLLRQWAAMKLEQAQRGNDAALMREAAQLYDAANQASVQATTELRDELSKLPKESDASTDKEAVEHRDSLRGEYLLALLRGAESLEEKADTEPAESPARKALLEQAAKSYEEMYKKYSEYLAGLRARFYQARCAAKLGDYSTALKILTEDLLSQTDTRPASRQLKTEALLLAMDGWMQEATKEYATVISQATAWLDTQHPAEEENPDWILLRLKLRGPTNSTRTSWRRRTRATIRSRRRAKRLGNWRGRFRGWRAITRKRGGCCWPRFPAAWPLRGRMRGSRPSRLKRHERGGRKRSRRCRRLSFFSTTYRSGSSARRTSRSRRSCRVRSPRNRKPSR